MTNTFILNKPFCSDIFNKYLEPARATNQFANYGYAVKLLEERARVMLKIDDSKAIIATCNGTAALHAMLYGIDRHDGTSNRVATQDFTFPSNSQGPAQGPIIVDMNDNVQINMYDKYLQEAASLVIVTNCFGHLQDIDYILEAAGDKKVIFDNAAAPYSFYKGTNSCNLGVGAYISLHHTKPIGFGEGGLVIIDKEYEESVRTACNFGLVDGQFNERGNNYKMSELAAAGILQWWDSFDIDELCERYVNNYFHHRYELRDFEGIVFPHYANEEDIFFPNCLPLIYSEPKALADSDSDVKKYYHPLRGLPNSAQLYANILCYPITEE